MRKIDETRTAVLFVHALNPHGFSYGRRVNEDNADFNRNFRDFATPPPVNAAYAEIHPLLLPPAWPPSRRKRGTARRVDRRARRARVSGGRQRRPIRVPRRAVLRWRAAVVEQSHAAFRAAASCGRAAAARVDRFPYGPRPAAATARRSTTAAPVGRRYRARARLVGRRTSRRSSMGRRRRRRSWGSTAMPSTTNAPASRTRRSRWNTGRFRSARRSRRCAPIIGCTIIPTAPAELARGDPPADARRFLRRDRRMENAGLCAGARRCADGAVAACASLR